MKSFKSEAWACRAVAWNEMWIRSGGPAFALNELRHGSLRFTQRSKRRLVGARGFEPPTSCSQSRRATRLRHAPSIYFSIFRHALKNRL